MISGVSAVIYISRVQASHGPRIKAGKKGYGSFSLSIEDKPKVVAGHVDLDNKTFKRLVDWVVLNKDLLLALWNDPGADYDEYKSKIRRLP